MNRNEPHEHPVSEWRHSHDFGAANPEGERRTAWVTGLTIGTMVAEIAAGWLTGSMALLADGWHMGTHAAAMGAAWGAFVFARRHARNPRFTFGTGKVGVLTAFGSAILLAGVALFMFWESGQRLLAPERIRVEEALLVAVIGLTVNVVCAWLLQAPHDTRAHHGAHGHHDHNMRAAYVHVLADALTSVLAIGALLAARQWGWMRADPLMGLVGGAIILRWAWTLGRETAGFLVDADVATSELNTVRLALESDGDSRVTDLHVWRVGYADKAVIATVVAGRPRPPSHYHALLASFPDLKHISVEVNPCAACVDASEPRETLPRQGSPME